nr:cytochrome c oxidase subunit II [Kradibia gibbosae]
MPMWGQMMFQDASSPIMQNMIFFHDSVMMIIFMITIVLIYMFIMMLKDKYMDLSLVHNELIEIIWTLLPMICLIFMALPSLSLLYLTDDLKNPDLSIKIIGHQWYWSYEYKDFIDKMFDSYIIKDFTDKEMFRLLDVDNYLVVPMNCHIRFLVSAMDVIHSFTLPALGIKVDAVPGRINQINTFIQRPGVYFGQCSEICGVNHSFMPIGMEVVDWKTFFKWLKKN